MNARTIIAGILVIAAVAFVVKWAIGGPEEEAGPFDRYATCSALISAFEVMPVPQSATARKELGDEYRARFFELDCSL